ncbi:MAG: RpiB/LacA/LacB family sugar-phosphate isomerase [bacterium]|nr:RpiB/LacA/LacB family sugar-phosphate isomerase [bacterium]
MTQKTIYIAGDHAAFELKEKIKKYLATRGYKIKDFGPSKYDPTDDYPDFVIPAARAVAASAVEEVGSRVAPQNAGRAETRPQRAAPTPIYGIVLGGSGIGECMAANKIKGIRAALVYDQYTAKMSREHNNANILCLGARTVTKNFSLVKKILNIWLTTPFSNEPRHIRRLKKIEK